MMPADETWETPRVLVPGDRPWLVCKRRPQSESLRILRQVLIREKCVVLPKRVREKGRLPAPGVRRDEPARISYLGVGVLDGKHLREVGPHLPGMRDPRQRRVEVVPAVIGD